jgi:hypothetical protein
MRPDLLHRGRVNVPDDRLPDGPMIPGWAHDAVVARYPSGTDPLAAIRESMTVFMEKADGTNALPGWQQRRWYHGGQYGLKVGDVLLPPSTTGRVPGLDFTDRDAVYVTSERGAAVLFATRHDRPTIYEVLIDPAVEPDVDDVIPNEDTSRRVRWARIHRIETPSRLELRRALYEIDNL